MPSTPKQLLLVTRQSPDWRQLAEDFRAVGAVDPSRFRPAESIPAFPANIVDLVDRWNAEMSIDFFTCRSQMKAISDETIGQLPGVRRSSYNLVAQIGPEISHYIVFFHDDDDWFSPDMERIINATAMEDHDVCVFPLARLWTDTCTFARRDFGADVIIGRESDFVFRYMSNNYGINGEICDEATLTGMKDHILASDFATQHGFRDFYIDKFVSVTSKTPCSASMLPIVFAADSHRQVRRYVEALQALSIPPDLAWMSRYVQRLIVLFSAVCVRSRRG